MSIDLKIGFRVKPKDLVKTMSSLGFALDKATQAGSMFTCRMDSYHFFDEHRSTRGVWFVYHDGTYVDHTETWQAIVGNPEAIVATGSVTTHMGRSGFDEEKQMQAAKYLRDHYSAVLYDPQSGQLITD